MSHRTHRILLFAIAVVVFGGPAWSQEARTHKVEITDFKFVPAVLNARVGDRVEFTNVDIAPHTATRRPTGWDTGTLKKNESWTLKISDSGTHNYFCRFHPNMKATIIVK